MHDGLDGEPARDTIRKTLYLALAVADGGDLGTLAVAAILFAHYDAVGDVHEPSGEVAGVCGLQRGVRKTLSAAVRGNEVFQNGKPFTEGRPDGQLYRAAGGVRHESAHTGKLTDLTHVASRAGVRHHPDGVEVLRVVHERLLHLVGGFLPGLDDGLITLVVREDTSCKVLFNALDGVFRLGDDIFLDGGDVHIEHARRDGAYGGILIPQRLYLVQHRRSLGRAVILEAVVNDEGELFLAYRHRLFAHYFEQLLAEHRLGVCLGTGDVHVGSVFQSRRHCVHLRVRKVCVAEYLAGFDAIRVRELILAQKSCERGELLLVQTGAHAEDAVKFQKTRVAGILAVDELQILRQIGVEDATSHRGVEHPGALRPVLAGVGGAYPHQRLQRHVAVLICHQSLVEGTEYLALAFVPGTDDGEII